MALSDSARLLGGVRGAMDVREMFWNNVIRDILMSLSVMKVRHDEALRQAHDEASVRAQTARDEAGRTITGPHVGGPPVGVPRVGGAAGGSVGFVGARASMVTGVAASPEQFESEGDEGAEGGEGFGDDAGVTSASVSEEDATLARALEEGIALSGVPPFDGRMGVVTTQGVRIGIADVYPLFACTIGETELEQALSEDVQCSVFQIRSPQGEVYTLPVHEIRAFHSLTEELMAQISSASASEDEEGVRTTVPFGFGAFTSVARAADSSRA